MAHKLIMTISRPCFEENEMKSLSVLILIAICFSMTGCSTLSHIVGVNFAAQHDNGLYENSTANRQIGSVRVYNNNPFTINLEIEESDSRQELEPHIGDGGASLNAYAACLTLKVIF